MPRIVDHAAERSELARRSTALFAQHGYAGLSMRKAAEGLGVSTGTHFETVDHGVASAAANSVTDVFPVAWESTKGVVKAGTASRKLSRLSARIKALPA